MIERFLIGKEVAFAMLLRFVSGLLHRLMSQRQTPLS